jgi:hypothetical protein
MLCFTFLILKAISEFITAQEISLLAVMSSSLDDQNSYQTKRQLIIASQDKYLAGAVVGELMTSSLQLKRKMAELESEDVIVYSFDQQNLQGSRKQVILLLDEMYPKTSSH